MDTSVGSGNQIPEQPGVRLGLFSDFPDLSDDASLVLLRIENDGRESIGESDYTSPGPAHGLTVVFTDRTVRRVSVPQLNAEHLTDHFARPGALLHSGNRIHSPVSR
ncbi:hypothetical protein [Streptomyces sp. NPDC005423]|uniref:hypothetical protein n=1 Tax=Streptomyces sp. NPDC005423 TaxID=3155343 RepID=UPI0033B7E653